MDGIILITRPFGQMLKLFILLVFDQIDFDNSNSIIISEYPDRITVVGEEELNEKFFGLTGVYERLSYNIDGHPAYKHKVSDFVFGQGKINTF